MCRRATAFRPVELTFYRRQLRSTFGLDLFDISR